jgi:5,5'-dehydrodivanillate O-demethylase
VLEKLGRPDLRREFTRVGGVDSPYRKIASERMEFGRLGMRWINNEWSPGGATVFPSMVRLPDNSCQIGVPMDDTHTLYFYYFAHDPDELKTQLGLEWVPQKDPREIPVYQVPVPQTKGELDWSILDNNSGQDLGMWRSQGEIMDRTREHLASSDQGIVLYRQLLEEQIKITEDGGEPMNVFRDPSRNECLAIPCGARGVKGAFVAFRNTAGVDLTFSARKYSPIFRAAAIKERGEKALKDPVT